MHVTDTQGIPNIPEKMKYPRDGMDEKETNTNDRYDNPRG